MTKEQLQPYISTEITLKYGSIGIGYIEVLAVKNGKIVSIGDFIWNIIRNKIPVSNELIARFGKMANQYYLGQIDIKPSMCFIDNKLGLLHTKETI